MSKLGPLLPAVIAVDRSSFDQAKANPIIPMWISSLRGQCRAVSRLVGFALDYREALCELEGLTEDDLRDLKFKRADFFAIAWTEAQRRYRAKAADVTAPLQGGHSARCIAR
jgi:uncharacterized protein YjiS (DUF1127 family)